MRAACPSDSSPRVVVTTSHDGAFLSVRSDADPPPPASAGADGRDAYLDNCKFALLLLIAIGHALQWLLAVEDGRTGRGWCESDPSSSSVAVLPLRALYTWSNYVAIPMFCIISGRLSQPLASACAAGEDEKNSAAASVSRRLRRSYESLLAPFLYFQVIACAVEYAVPDLRSALAPGGPGSVTPGDSATDPAAIESASTLPFWQLHISWYLLALALWRGFMPAFAKMRQTALICFAIVVGTFVGFTDVGTSDAYFLKWGTVLGNFPYFVIGLLFFTDEAYVFLRDQCNNATVRVGSALCTLLWALGVLIVGLAPPGEMGSLGGFVCFDAWQWEAWKSAPYAHYAGGGFFYNAGRPGGGDDGNGDGNGDGGRVDLGGTTASFASHFWAAFFRAVTYGEALLFGALFLLTLPREETFLATAGGSRTMYGYLLHAPAILGAMALCGVFTRAGEGLGLDAWEWVICGVVAPAAIATACMTAPAKTAFQWLCEPKLQVWKEE